MQDHGIQKETYVQPQLGQGRAWDVERWSVRMLRENEGNYEGKMRRKTEVKCTRA